MTQANDFSTASYAESKAHGDAVIREGNML